MTEASVTQEMARKFGPHTLIIGILLMILGAVGFALPGLMSLGTAVFVSWLLIGGAIRPRCNKPYRETGHRGIHRHGQACNRQAVTV